MGRVTLQTIADKVGVSRMTVSNAFSRPDQLSAELRARVLAAAEELGYVGPDPAARALARGTTGAVGVLLTDSVRSAFEDDIATGFFGAVADSLTPTGLALALLPDSGADAMIPARDIPMDGALVYSCAGDSPALQWLIKRKLPLVFVDQVPVPGSSGVILDDRGGSRAAAQHVLDFGHRRVGLLTMGYDKTPGEVADPTAAGSGYVAIERVRGWLEALDPAEVRPVVVQTPENTEQDAYDGARLLLEREDRPTAILCFSDLMAWGVVHAALDLGLRVPADLSVVGFDDGPLASRMRPSLTTVRQDLVAKGRLAVEALTEAIEQARAGTVVEPRVQLMAADLVVRESTGPAPTAPAPTASAPTEP